MVNCIDRMVNIYPYIFRASEPYLVDIDNVTYIYLIKIDMFKYFSDILKNFTPAQRMIALSLLLLTVFLATTGPSFIKSFRDDNKVLVDRVILQNRVIDEMKLDIKKLNKDIDTLNYQLRINQIECTNLVIRREKEIMSQIVVLEQNISRKQTMTSLENLTGQKSNDSIHVVMSMLPDPDSDFLRQVQSIKTELQKSIDNKILILWK